MKIVVCGLSISSAWGNGHATLLRGLFRALHRRGHSIHFFEQDTPYYASHRDATGFTYVDLHLYSDWKEVTPEIRRELSDADIGMVTSYCPQGAAASQLLLDSHLPRTVFYDMDTPVTISRLRAGERVPYLPEGGLNDFDLVLSYTGGGALDELRQRLGARHAAALYGWVDPNAYFPSQVAPQFVGDLSYLGTYSPDRQDCLENLLIGTARSLSDRQFVLGGAMYEGTEKWPANIKYFKHVDPPLHSFFYSSCPLTLNITRASMAAMGYCPSGRLFEAAACGAAILSDRWQGLECFFEPGEEILIADSTADAIDVLNLDETQVAAIARRARERTLDCHTAEIRAQRFLQLVETPGSDSVLTQTAAYAGKGR